jgi:Rrf2 family protein
MAEYGIRVMIRLSCCHTDGRLRLQDFKKEEKQTSYVHYATLVRLRANGFIDSKAGRRGGFSLARTPDNIRIAELIACLERGRPFDGKRQRQPGSFGKAFVRTLEQIINRQISKMLKDMTLADLIESAIYSQRTGAWTYYI